MDKYLKRHFRLTALDIRRLFEIAIFIHILSSITLIIYFIGDFFSQQGLPFPSIVCKGLSLFFGFLLLFRFYSALTMKHTVKQAVKGKITVDDIFTVPVAKRRITWVLIYTLPTLLIYLHIVSLVDLGNFTDKGNILLWGITLSNMIHAFIYGYCRFYIERARMLLQGIRIW